MTTENQRPTLGPLNPGDTVYVRRSANDMRRRDASERYIEARVVKAARVWIDLVQAAPRTAPIQWRMRRDTQNEGTQYIGSNSSFVTPAQREWDETLAAARADLSAQGLTLRHDSVWSGREVELAEILRNAA